MPEKKKYLTLNEIDAYKISHKLSNYLWLLINKWDFLAQKSIGLNFMNSVDSISANLAMGFGSYSKADKIRFYRISFSYVYECFDWNEKSKMRKIIDAEQYSAILNDLKKLPQAINELINYTNETFKY